MARNNSSPVQQFRGTTAQHNTYTGLPGELTVDTDKHVVVVHDGSTAGGHPTVPDKFLLKSTGGILTFNDGAEAPLQGDSIAVEIDLTALEDALVTPGAATLDPSWIGVPRYWRSTTLPANHCWANGDFVSFADWPELKKVYDAGGFEGMLMAWNADAGTQAANLGKWRPNASIPTGLYTPALSEQFFRNWGPEGDNPAGGWASDAMRALTGMASFARGSGGGAILMDDAEGVFHVDRNGISIQAYTGSSNYFPLSRLFFDSSRDTPTGPENVPPHIWQPVILYLGRPAQV